MSSEKFCHEQQRLSPEDVRPPEIVGKEKMTLEEAFILYAHTAFYYGIYLFFASAKWPTVAFVVFLMVLAAYGVKNTNRKTSKSESRLRQMVLLLLNALAFQHVAFGWLRCKPMTFHGLTETEQFNLKDDPMFALKKAYAILVIGIMCFAIPTFLPLIWNESLNNSWHVAVIFRYISSWNTSFMILQKAK